MARRRKYVRDARGRFADVPGSAERARKRRRKQGLQRVGRRAVRAHSGPAWSLAEGISGHRKPLAVVAGAKLATGLSRDINDVHHVLATTSKRKPPRTGHTEAYRKRRRVLRKADSYAGTALATMETIYSAVDLGKAVRGRIAKRRARHTAAQTIPQKFPGRKRRTARVRALRQYRRRTR